MVLGLKLNEIELVPHDPEWEKAFLEEKERIAKIISNKIIGIEHVGSTAIKTIKAKPIIDIAISLKKYDDGSDCIDPIVSIGYEYKGEFGVPGRHFFRTNDEFVKFHLHMFEISSKSWNDLIFFRDYMNRNPEKAKEYEDLKFRLRQECQGNRDLYTQHKETFVKEILEKASKEKK